MRDPLSGSAPKRLTENNIPLVMEIVILILLQMSPFYPTKLYPDLKHDLILASLIADSHG